MTTPLAREIYKKLPQRCPEGVVRKPRNHNPLKNKGWAVSSAGRAPGLHPGGRQFETVTAHHASPLRATCGAATRRPLGRSSIRRSLSEAKAKTGWSGILLTDRPL